MNFKKIGYKNFGRLFDECKGDSENTPLTRVLYNLILTAAIAGIVLFAIDCFLIVFGDKEKVGVFGDFFGGILNPILTFLTFFGLVITIVIQRQELKLARVEYDKTSDALNTQAIETTFFNILDLHHKIVDNLKLNISELRYKTGYTIDYEEIDFTPNRVAVQTTFEGRAVFEEVLKFLTRNSASPDEVVERYKSIQDGSNHMLGHYFRNLYQALKLIHNYDDSKVTESNRRKYASILRAQLSTKELALLFINCLEGVCDQGQFKNLLIEYAMLEHLPVENTKNGYLLAGSTCAIASDEMILQYGSKKDLGINLKKYYGGAFGQNPAVPYNLTRASAAIFSPVHS